MAQKITLIRVSNLHFNCCYNKGDYEHSKRHSTYLNSISVGFDIVLTIDLA